MEYPSSEKHERFDQTMEGIRQREGSSVLGGRSMAILSSLYRSSAKINHPLSLSYDTF